VVLASFVPDYSGVAVPDFHGVPFSASSHLNTDQFLLFHTTISKGMSTLFNIFGYTLIDARRECISPLMIRLGYFQTHPLYPVKREVYNILLKIDRESKL
jgi:hypothetical protein